MLKLEDGRSRRVNVQDVTDQVFQWDRISREA
jgi:hypothetical protein